MIPAGAAGAIHDGDVSVLLHLSDAHFGVEDPLAVNALLTLAEHERPDVVLASGDITRSGRASEFDSARRFFSRIATRHTLVVPGDDDLPRWDLPRRLLAPFSGFRRVFGDNLEPRLTSPLVWVAGLVSARRWRGASGSLSADQIERTAQWLAGAPPGVLKVVMAHHPLAAQQWHQEDNVIGGADGALARWALAGVHVVLGGHTHMPYALALGRTAEAAKLWVVQAGSALSRRLHAGGAHSVNLLRRSATGAWRIEQWDLHREAGMFSRRSWRYLDG